MIRRENWTFSFETDVLKVFDFEIADLVHSMILYLKISVTRDKIWNIFAATWWRSVTFLIKSDVCPSKETKNKIDQFIIFRFDIWWNYLNDSRVYFITSHHKDSLK